MKTTTPDCRNSRSLSFTASALITTLAIALLVPGASALAADQKKPSGQKPIKCDADHCRKVFDELGQTCNNPTGKPMPGELRPRCECKCMDPGGARKKKV